MRALVLLVVGFLSFVACGASNASSPDSDTAKNVSPIDVCAKDSDCILAVGNPCSPCGSCPGEPSYATTPASLKQYIATTEYCPQRAYIADPSMQRPSCGPCASSTPAPSVHAVCKKSACATEPDR